MPRVLPFHGVRFDWRRVALKEALCPPYDVIPDAMARRLRAGRHNAIHLELPAGGKRKYEAAAKTWRRWLDDGVLIRDLIPSLYVIEQSFEIGGKAYRRTGFLGSLRLDEGLRQVTPHEKTFSKPKQDRWKLLDAVKAQISPIFALYEDPGSRVRKVLARVTSRPAAAEGRAPDGVTVKVWRAIESDALAGIERAFATKRLLIADGHHRLEVSKSYGCRGVMCYLCAEEDPGLRVLPTHRIVAEPAMALEKAAVTCRLKPVSSLRALEAAIGKQASPFSFGIVSKSGRSWPGRYVLAIPTEASARGIRSGLGVEWLARRLFGEQDRLTFTHDSREAASMADGSGAAFLVKPVEVAAIRKAVRRIGLLPQKSTYFYPKVEAGIVFHEIR